VAAGRKKVFSRVAEARALAAQANRARFSRSRGISDVSGGGSTTSAGSPPLRQTQALGVVSSFFIYLTVRLLLLVYETQMYLVWIYL
jgi:hypothetical protein